MSASPYQSEIMEKKRNMDVLGRQIDANMLAGIRNRIHHTPLQSTSKFILSNDFSRNKVSNVRVSSLGNNSSNQKGYHDGLDYDHNPNYQPESYYNPNQQSQSQSHIQSQRLPQSQQYQQSNRPRAFSNEMLPSKSQAYIKSGQLQREPLPSNKGPIMRYNEPYSEHYGSSVEPDNKPRLMPPGEYDRGFDFTKNDRYLYKHSPYPKYPMLDPINNRIGKGNLLMNDQYQYYQEPVHYSKQFHRDRVGEGNGSRYQNLAIYPTMKDVMTPLDKSRSDYDNSRFGDYTYNFFLNAPMRANVSEDWKYPPEYYYNGRYDPKTRAYVSY